MPLHDLARVVDDHEPAEVRHDRQHRAERPLEVMVGFLLVAVIVADRVGDGRPAVAQVPHHEPALLRELLRAEELHLELDGLRLRALRLRDEEVEVVARHVAEQRRRLLQDEVVAGPRVDVRLQIGAGRAVAPLRHPVELLPFLRVGVRPDARHVCGGHHLLDRGTGGQRVRAALAAEPAGVVRVVGRLPPRARTAPEVVLARLGLALERGGAHVGRAGQVGARHVVLVQHGGDRLARDAVFVGVAHELLAEPPAASLVVLVVPGPERDRRMVAVAHHDGAHLLLDGLGERVVHRRHRAGHHEVLPHHHAVLVAPVEERVRLVHAAAPHAHEVAVEVGHHRQGPRELRRLAGRDGVERDPVDAAHVDRLAVDLEEEASRTLRQLAVVVLELDGADADPAHVAREDRPVRAHQLDRRVVERLRARAARPPELGVGERQAHAAVRPPVHARAGGDDLAAARERGTHGRLVAMAERRGDAGARKDMRPARFDVQVAHDPRRLLDAGRRTHLEPHVAPDAAHGQVRHRVPPVHVRRLAEVLVARAAAHRVAELAEAHLSRREAHRTDQHLHRVLRADPNPIRHVELVRDEHVVGLADLFAVEEHVRERVDAVEHEHRPLARLARRAGEGLRVEPLVAFVGHERERVRGKKRIWHFAGLDKLHLAAAGHGRLIALHRQSLRQRQRTDGPVVWLGEGLQLPRAVEVDVHSATIKPTCNERRRQRDNRQHSSLHFRSLLSGEGNYAPSIGCHAEKYIII